jgi:hypothetical protein
VSPSELFKDRAGVILMIEDLFNWPHASSWVSFALAGPISERLPSTGSGEMAGVHVPILQEAG